MFEHYQVKFTRQGRTYYGIARYNAPEAKPGELIIDDAILPTAYRVLESQVTDIEAKFGNYDMTLQRFVGGDEYQTYVQDELEKAEKLSKSLGGGVKVGKLFNTPVADGAAYYVVTKVNKKTCKVEWRGFCPDRYVDHWLGYGKTVPLADIKRLVGLDEALEEIFNRR